MMKSVAGNLLLMTPAAVWLSYKTKKNLRIYWLKVINWQETNLHILSVWSGEFTRKNSQIYEKPPPPQIFLEIIFMNLSFLLRRHIASLCKVESTLYICIYIYTHKHHIIVHRLNHIIVSFQALTGYFSSFCFLVNVWLSFSENIS